MSEYTKNSLRTEVEETAQLWREKPHHLLAPAAAKALEETFEKAYSLGRKNVLAEIALANSGININDIGELNDGYEGQLAFKSIETGKDADVIQLPTRFSDFDNQDMVELDGGA